MITIDLDRIRTALPDRATVTLGKTKHSTPYLEIFVNPSLSEKDFDMCIDWQCEIIGKENIMEFYTEETGHHWFVYLKRVPMEFIGASDENVNSFTKMELVKDGKLVK